MNNMKKFNMAFTPKSQLEEFISLAETSKNKTHSYWTLDKLCFKNNQA